MTNLTTHTGTMLANAARSMRSRLRPPGGRYILLSGCVLLLWLLSFIGFGTLSSRNNFNIYLSYVLLAIGFYWIYGLSGQFSFAHAGFAALGAYTSGWLARQSLPLPAAVLAATFITGAIAALILLLLRKASAFYFAIATLGLGSLFIFVLLNWDAFTGGTDGQTTVAMLTWAGRPMSGAQISVVFLLAVTGVYILAALIDLSPLRREATALKYRSQVAQVCGVPDLAIRMSLFSLGCAVAALAGALQGHANGFLATDSFGTDLGIGIFLMIVVGGEYFLAGPLLGAAFYVFFPVILETVGLGAWETLLYGVTLILFMIFMPAGILGGLDRLRAMLWSVGRAPASGHQRQEVAPAAARPGAPSPARSMIDSSQGPDHDLARTARLFARDLRVSFGGVHAVDGISFYLRSGEVLGIVGPNGSGKSTTLNALTGLVGATGEVRIDSEQCKLSAPGATRRRGVMRAFQTPQIYSELNCIDNVALADSDRRGTSIVAAVFRPWMVRRHERARASRARNALAFLGLDDLVDRPTSALSYGEQRWLELARSIVADARIVLLDEPSAGLNDQETTRLQDVIYLLRDRGAGVVVVDHKVDFISAACSRVIVLDFGKIIAEGTPHKVFADPVVIEAYVGPHLAGSDVTAQVSDSRDASASPG